MGQYLPIILLAALALVFGVVSIFVSHLLAPKKPNPIKSSPYECGVDPITETPDRFPVKFFLIAMIFIVFDVEIIFLYPWAVSYGALGLFGLVAILIFSFAVFESFLYLLSKGVFNWNTLRTGLGLEQEVQVETNGSTIRRVSNKDTSKVGAINE